jgi:hypothetical protein
MTQNQSTTEIIPNNYHGLHGPGGLIALDHHLNNILHGPIMDQKLL